LSPTPPKRQFLIADCRSVDTVRVEVLASSLRKYSSSSLVRSAWLVLDAVSPTVREGVCVLNLRLYPISIDKRRPGQWTAPGVLDGTLLHDRRVNTPFLRGSVLVEPWRREVPTVRSDYLQSISQSINPSIPSRTPPDHHTSSSGYLSTRNEAATAQLVSLLHFAFCILHPAQEPPAPKSFLFASVQVS
jgi:hypothetical protein